MQRQFSEEYREAESPAARRRFLLRAFIDVLATAPGELARGLSDDLRHALRIYRKSPGSTALAVVALAIAMAFVSAFVSLYVDLILRPYPGFAESGRLVTIGWTDGRNSGRLPAELIDRMADDVTTLEAVAGTAYLGFAVGPDRERLGGEVVTRDFFARLRPRLALGRGFEPAEHSADGPAVVVVSHAYWQNELDGYHDVLGQTITIDGRSSQASGPTEFRIVGVMDERLPGAAVPNGTMFWMPVERALALMEGDINAINAAASMRTIGRRSRRASVAAVARDLDERYSDSEIPRGAGFGAIRFDVLDGLVYDLGVQRSTARQLRLFLGASLLLALVAAANVSLFLLARAPGRRRELGIRLSIGAPLGRLARQLASEAGILVLAAAILGIALSAWLAQFLRGLAFLRDAQWRDVTLLDWRVLVLVSVFLLGLGILISLAPILGLRRLGIAGSSRIVSARPSLAQRLAGSAQIAIAAALGGAAIAFGAYLVGLTFEYPGYETRDRYAVSYSIQRRFEQGRVYGNAAVDDPRRRDAMLSIPGVTAVSFAGAVPGLQLTYRGLGLPHLTDANRRIRVQSFPIDSHYVDVLGLEVLRGRGPKASEDAVLVNRALARAMFDRDDVVGETLTIGAGPGLRQKDIVGVLADLSYEHPDAELVPMVFETSGHDSDRNIAIVETALSAAELQQALQGLVDAGALELRVMDVAPLGVLRNETMAADRARSALTFVAAALVVVLAAVGFYGTQRYLVTAGRREYAIRASLGAGPRALGRLVLRRGFELGLPGFLLGLPLSYIVVNWVRDNFLSREISALAVTAVVALALFVLSIAASAVPARQARHAQPAPLLRED